MEESKQDFIISGRTKSQKIMFTSSFYSLISCNDKFTDLEKKTFLKNFLSDVFIYEEEQKDGRILKGLRFKFPIYMNGRNVLGVDCPSTQAVQSFQLCKEAFQPL